MFTLEDATRGYTDILFIVNRLRGAGFSVSKPNTCGLGDV